MQKIMQSYVMGHTVIYHYTFRINNFLAGELTWRFVTVLVFIIGEYFTHTHWHGYKSVEYFIQSKHA